MALWVVCGQIELLVYSANDDADGGRYLKAGINSVEVGMENFVEMHHEILLHVADPYIAKVVHAIILICTWMVTN